MRIGSTSVSRHWPAPVQPRAQVFVWMSASNTLTCTCVADSMRTEPAGQLGMTIGLADFRDPGELRLDRLLTQRFRDDQTPAAP